MIFHSEVFWSLFAVDMAALLEMQPPDTWDSFQLFQVLNDHLRCHGKLLLITIYVLEYNRVIEYSHAIDYMLCIVRLNFWEMRRKLILESYQRLGKEASSVQYVSPVKITNIWELILGALAW